MMKRNRGSAAESMPGRDRVGAAAGGPSSGTRRWLVPVFIILATGVAFLPALGNGFLNWDDGKNLLENQNYRGLGWSQLRWMFTTFHLGHYQPLSWVTFGLDYLVWGMDPFGYHLTNILIHAANAVLCYFLTMRLLSLSTLAAAGEHAVRLAAALSALLFAVHPLRVESVAWVTERRDVLSGFFFLLTLLCYLKYAAGQERKVSRLGLALLVYCLSLLSKAVGMTLPLVLLVLDVYPLRRLGGGPGRWFGRDARMVWREKIPFFALAAAAGVVALLAQRETGALNTLERHGAAFRLAQAFYGLAFYLWKTVIPLGLSPLYERPPHMRPWDWPFVLSGAVVLSLSVGLSAARRSWPAGLASWISYIFLLAPVLGVAQSGPQFVADRYTYLPCLGWSILAGAGLLLACRARLDGVMGKGIFWFIAGSAGMVLVGLGVLTWKQGRVWHDSERLWRHVLLVRPETSYAQNNLGSLLSGQGKWGEALEHFRDALAINPRIAEVHYNIGNILYKNGQAEEAVGQYLEALRDRPRYPEANYNLGMALESRGRLAEAMEQYREALRFKPGDVEAHNNLANILLRSGRFDEAMGHYREALRLQPDYADTHYNIGVALASRGRLEEAVEHYREALRIRPGFAEARQALNRVVNRRPKP